MRRLCYLMLIITSLLANRVCAQPNADGPRFEFIGGDLHDFGTVPEGPEQTHVFLYKNVGKTPLIITGAVAGCTCTSATFSKAPVLPGQTGTITVRYATNGHPGVFNKDIYIQSNAILPPNMEQYELHIKGVVKPASKAK